MCEWRSDKAYTREDLWGYFRRQLDQVIPLTRKEKISRLGWYLAWIITDKLQYKFYHWSIRLGKKVDGYRG